MPFEGENNDIVDRIFELVDANSDGHINADEANVLATVMFDQCGLPMNLKSYKALLLAMDGQAPFGQIDKDEFRVFFRKQQDKNSANRSHPAFGDMTAQSLTELEQKVHMLKSTRAGDDFVKVTTEANIKDEYVKVKVLGKGAHKVQSVQ